MTPTRPFELEHHDARRWGAMWRAQKLRVVVAGDQASPDAALARALYDLVARWPEVTRGVAEFVAALAPDHHVPLDPPHLGGFAAGTCGFDGALNFEALVLDDRTTPTRAALSFYTGSPDGYATFVVELDHGAPVRVTAYAA